MKAPRCDGGEPGERQGEERPRRGANLHEDLETGLLALLGFDQLQGDGLVRAEVRSHLLDFLLGQAVELGGHRGCSVTPRLGPPRPHPGLSQSSSAPLPWLHRAPSIPSSPSSRITRRPQGCLAPAPPRSRPSLPETA